MLIPHESKDFFKLILKFTGELVWRAENIIISNFQHPKISSCFTVLEDKNLQCFTVTLCG